MQKRLNFQGGEMMVGARGFEPPTLWSQTRCAARLRYAPSHVIQVAEDITANIKRQENTRILITTDAG